MGVDPFDRRLEMEKPKQQGNNRAELEGSGEVLIYEDIGNIADLLPVDPLGLDIRSTVTAVEGSFQDIDEDFVFNFDELRVDEMEIEIDEGCNSGGSLACPDWFFDGPTRLQPQKGVFCFNRMSIPDDGFDESKIGRCSDLRGFNCKSSVSVGNEVGFHECKQLEGGGGDRHYALLLALGYLDVEDLLAVEGVCRSLRDAVRDDPLPWRSFQIIKPLSLKITDEVLVKLTNRAQGALECLNLVDCINITNGGLKQVIEKNPKLIKLSVPGCVRLTVNSILNNLRVLKFAGNLRVKQLRIGGLRCVSGDDFEELRSLISVDKCKQMRANKPQFFHQGPVYLSCDDDRPIDVEPCPICERVALVYDCPAEGCGGKDQTDQICRACTLCISRCIQCGCCIKDHDYEETFFLDFICLDCLKQPRSLEKPKAKVLLHVDQQHSFMRR